MRLSNKEIDQVKDFLNEKTPELNYSILEKIEIGFWLIPPIAINQNISPALKNLNINREQKEPLFISGALGPNETLEIFRWFKTGDIPYLLVRRESWECFLECGNQILSSHCDEDQDSKRECCNDLRKKCGNNKPQV